MIGHIGIAKPVSTRREPLMLCSKVCHLNSVSNVYNPSQPSFKEVDYNYIHLLKYKCYVRIVNIFADVKYTVSPPTNTHLIGLFMNLIISLLSVTFVGTGPDDDNKYSQNVDANDVNDHL